MAIVEGQQASMLSVHLYIQYDYHDIFHIDARP